MYFYFGSLLVLGMWIPFSLKIHVAEEALPERSRLQAHVVNDHIGYQFILCNHGKSIFYIQLINLVLDDSSPANKFPFSLEHHTLPFPSSSHSTPQTAAFAYLVWLFNIFDSARSQNEETLFFDFSPFHSDLRLSNPRGGWEAWTSRPNAHYGMEKITRFLAQSNAHCNCVRQSSRCAMGPSPTNIGENLKQITAFNSKNTRAQYFFFLFENETNWITCVVALTRTLSHRRENGMQTKNGLYSLRQHFPFKCIATKELHNRRQCHSPSIQTVRHLSSCDRSVYACMSECVCMCLHYKTELG